MSFFRDKHAHHTVLRGQTRVEQTPGKATDPALEADAVRR